MLSGISRVRLLATPWTLAHQAPLSMAFSRQEYWSGLLCPRPGGLPDSGMEPASPDLQAASLPLSRRGCPIIGSRCPNHMPGPAWWSELPKAGTITLPKSPAQRLQQPTQGRSDSNQWSWGLHSKKKKKQRAFLSESLSQKTCAQDFACWRCGKATGCLFKASGAPLVKKKSAPPRP